MATPWSLAQEWKRAAPASTAVAVAQASPSYTLFFGTCSVALKPSVEVLADAAMALEENDAPAVADVREELLQWCQWLTRKKQEHRSG